MSALEKKAAEPRPQRQNLVGLPVEELVRILGEAGQPAFRARQLYEWIYRKGAADFTEMSSLSKDLRALLMENHSLDFPEIAEVRGGAADGSRKLLFRLPDHRIVESVLMQDKGWKTLCVSSQVGCAVDCKFCMTGFGGFRRQMTTGEIVSQFLLARRLNDGIAPRNMVFMGMGEPMLNLDNVIPAIRLLTDKNGMEVSPRRITVSTSGIVPGIDRLGEADLGVNLAISLNASNDEFRSRIMPINKRWPISELLDACRRFPLRNRRRITFEYVMLAGENDSIQNARELGDLLQNLPCKINLIPWNPDPNLPFHRPDEETIRRFQQELLDRYFTVSVRYSKGIDIGAACGQLAGHWEQEKKTEALAQ
jgi:23S rRNA (adenine2503-C2)-methyltransferase